jgi:hypothetical protein
MAFSRAGQNRVSIHNRMFRIHEPYLSTHTSIHGFGGPAYMIHLAPKYADFNFAVVELFLVIVCLAFSLLSTALPCSI